MHTRAELLACESIIDLADFAEATGDERLERVALRRIRELSRELLGGLPGPTLAG